MTGDTLDYGDPHRKRRLVVRAFGNLSTYSTIIVMRCDAGTGCVSTSTKMDASSPCKGVFTTPRHHDGGADAVLLGGSVAENAPAGAELTLDAQAYRAAIVNETCFTLSGSHAQAWVVTVDETALIAAAADSLLHKQEDLR